MFLKLRGFFTSQQTFNAKQILKSLNPKTIVGKREKCEGRSQATLDCCETRSLMDEVPHPEGSWSQNFERQDSKNNKILITGLIIFMYTASIMKNTDVVKGYPEVTLF